MECEDTEMDDILEDIMDTGKSIPKRDNSSSNLAGLSSAMDARLECSLDTNVEIFLRRLTMMTSLDLFANLTINNENGFNVELPSWPDITLQAWSGHEYNQGCPTNIMLSCVFDDIFTDLSRQDSWLSLEHVLQLWLTLNGELCEMLNRNIINSNELTKIPFGLSAVQGLLSALSWHQGIKLRCWCLGIKCLTLACNPCNSSRNRNNIVFY